MGASRHVGLQTRTLVLVLGCGAQSHGGEQSEVAASGGVAPSTSGEYAQSQTCVHFWFQELVLDGAAQWIAFCL
jgi:hypothetical protein